MKKPTKAQKEALRKQVARIQTMLLLSEWKVTITFKPNPKDGEADDTSETLADVTPLSQYHEANINIYPAFWSQRLAARPGLIMHELLHLIVNPIVTLAEEKCVTDEVAEAEERTVSHLAHILEKRGR